MEYTSKMFVDFLEKLIDFDKNAKYLIETALREKNMLDAKEREKWIQIRTEADQQLQTYFREIQSTIVDFRNNLDDTLTHDINEKSTIFSRIQD